jgi:WS/DGAT/MGAT family acyltransferase
VRSAPSLITHATDIPGAGSVPLAGLLASVTRSSRPFTAPRTRLNRRVGSRRAFAFSTLPLDEVKTVRKAFGLTINDVVMTLCTGAMRRWLEEHDALPSGPLVAGIPVSVRTAEEFGTGGNRITFMITPLPTDLADPLARADRLKMSLANAKRRIAASPPRLLDDGAAMLPQVLHGLVPRTLLTLTRVVPPPINLLVSNVPGPQFALYAAGARVVSNHPVSVISDVTGGVNITVMSYDGHLDIGVVACSRIMPDVWKLSRYLRDALDELLVLAEDSAEDRTESGTRTA